jgi:hypothetical protein
MVGPFLFVGPLGMTGLGKVVPVGTFSVELASFFPHPATSESRASMAARKSAMDHRFMICFPSMEKEWIAQNKNWHPEESGCQFFGNLEWASQRLLA